jgi:methylase of polypeptide subunit release factors
MTRTVVDHIFEHTGVDLNINPLPESEFALLESASNGDSNLLSCYLKRRISGEPLAYILGYIEFDGIQIPIDKRAYITDPEAIYLVSHLKHLIQRKPRIQILEVGTGCGSLSFSLERSHPHHLYTAVDIDSDAIALAQSTADRFESAISFRVSDYFLGLPETYIPDLIFADPPWGNDTSLYHDDRPAAHYHAMPGISVWPFKSITGIHEQIIDEILLRQWNCDVYLNFGMLDIDSIHAALIKAPQSELIHAAHNVTIARLTF